MHEKGICGLCGGCVSFCSANQIKAIEMQPNAPPKYVNEDACLKCGICYLICPQINALNDELNAKFQFQEPIGHVENIYTATATDQEILFNATDGGVVTALLQSMLAEGLIDGAIVCKNVGSFQRIPFLAKTKEDISAAAGTHMDMVGQVGALERYNTFIPILSQLRNLASEDLQDIAVVGVPCQIHSIRKMQELSIIPTHIVKYALGLFCYENFDFSEHAREMMEQRFGFSFTDIQKMNIKDDLLLTLSGENQVQIPFDELDDFMRPACQACQDFSNYYADISFGGLGSSEGFTTVLTRTEKGKSIYNLGLRRKVIKEPSEFNSPVNKSKIFAKIINFAQKKQLRAANFRKEVF